MSYQFIPGPQQPFMPRSTALDHVYYAASSVERLACNSSSPDLADLFGSSHQVYCLVGLQMLRENYTFLPEVIVTDPKQLQNSDEAYFSALIQSNWLRRLRQACVKGGHIEDFSTLCPVGTTPIGVSSIAPHGPSSSIHMEVPPAEWSVDNLRANFFLGPSTILNKDTVFAPSKILRGLDETIADVHKPWDQDEWSYSVRVGVSHIIEAFDLIRSISTDFFKIFQLLCLPNDPETAYNIWHSRDEYLAREWILSFWFGDLQTEHTIRTSRAMVAVVDSSIYEIKTDDALVREAADAALLCSSNPRISAASARDLTGRTLRFVAPVSRKSDFRHPPECPSEFDSTGTWNWVRDLCLGSGGRIRIEADYRSGNLLTKDLASLEIGSANHHSMIPFIAHALIQSDNLENFLGAVRRGALNLDVDTEIMDIEFPVYYDQFFRAALTVFCARVLAIRRVTQTIYPLAIHPVSSGIFHESAVTYSVYKANP